MIRTFIAVAATGSFALASAAGAAEAAKAEITAVKGAVSVHQSGKLADARPGALRAGDRVISRDGQAKLTYTDGCVVTLKPGSMATIGEASPCAVQQGLVTAGGASAQSSFGELSPFGMVMGVLAVGGLIYGIGSLIENQNNDDDAPRPVSP